MSIHESVERGDVAALLAELDHGDPVDQLDEQGRTPLRVAVSTPNADPQIIRLLIQRGADARIVDANGYSMLTEALYRSNGSSSATWLDVLTLLIDAGAPLDVASQYNESPLSVASRRADCAAIELLLSRGADPSPLEWTPLFHAIAAGDAGLVERLLDDGADLNQRDTWERTPLLFAIQSNQPSIARRLVECGSDVSATGRCGSTALHHAIPCNDVEMLRWLIELGCDIEQSDEMGEFPLLAAVQSDAPDCVQALLDAGANVQRRDNFDRPIITHATTPRMIDVLVAAGQELSDIESEMRSTLLRTNRVRQPLARVITNATKVASSDGGIPSE